MSTESTLRVFLVQKLPAVQRKDFGDFFVWRNVGFPSYEMGVVVEDQSMLIREVVRGEDLLTSTARQLLLYDALNWLPPAYYHCPLFCDDNGERLAKRNDSHSLRKLRGKAVTPESLRKSRNFIGSNVCSID